jgi:hypothetical protein
MEGYRLDVTQGRNQWRVLVNIGFHGMLGVSSVTEQVSAARRAVLDGVN